MATGNAAENQALVSDRYVELVRACPLRPIRCEAELDRAIEMLDRLIDQPSLTSDERDFMSVLGGLVERYEEVHHPMPSDREG